MANKVTLTEVEAGTATLSHLLKLNALLDLEVAQTNAAMAKARKD